jgi:hypothetical protein
VVGVGEQAGGSAYLVENPVQQVDFLMPCATRQNPLRIHLQNQIVALPVLMDPSAWENLMQWHRVLQELVANHHLKQGPVEAALHPKWY